MKKEVYTFAIMPSSGRRMRTFSISAISLTWILASCAVILIFSIVFGSLATWRLYRRQEQEAVEAVNEVVQKYEALEKELQDIRKSYSEFKIILGIEPERFDDEQGKGGPDMPELTGVSAEEIASEASTDMSSTLTEAAFLKSGLDNLTRIVGDKIVELIMTPSIWPVRFEPRSQLWISSRFGRRRNPFSKRFESHEGVDIPSPRGTPIIATADGTVSKMEKNAYMGNFIQINHGGRFVTLYGHMHRFDKDIKKGTKVKRGDIIGYVGRTGRATGSHVHYEIRDNGKPVNPENYILNR